MTAHRMIGRFVACVLVALPMAAFAQGVASGQNEVAGLLTYADVDADAFETQDTKLQLAYGRYFTEMHELGVAVSYTKNEVKEDGFGSVSVDGTTFGVFYHLNFPMDGIVTPFIGLNLAAIGGDVGDLYDMEYGVSAGIKVYPFEHAGVSLGASYSKLQGAESYIDDADGIALAAGLLIRF